MNRIVLLGDSVFDNGVYVPGRPDVAAQLCAVLPANWSVIRLARDGAYTEDVHDQLDFLPENVAHIFVSVGGNDGLRQLKALLDAPLKTLSRVPSITQEFREEYGAMLDAVVDTGLPATVCTVYGGDFPDWKRRSLAKFGTGVINKVITEEARKRTIPVLDLRKIFTASEDYTCTVEPSAQGGEKLARAIATLVVDNQSTKEDHGYDAQATTPVGA